MSVIVVLIGAGVGYEIAKTNKGEPIMGLIVGGFAGILVSALLFGMIYLLIEIAEQTKLANLNAKKSLEQNGRLLAAIEQRLATNEIHMASICDAKVRDRAARPVEAAIAGS
jgi:hypothetical protein